MNHLFPLSIVIGPDSPMYGRRGVPMSRWTSKQAIERHHDSQSHRGRSSSRFVKVFWHCGLGRLETSIQHEPAGHEYSLWIAVRDSTLVECYVLRGADRRKVTVGGGRKATLRWQQNGR
jgi:hypothetical protein